MAYSMKVTAPIPPPSLKVYKAGEPASTAFKILIKDYRNCFHYAESICVRCHDEWADTHRLLYSSTEAGRAFKIKLELAGTIIQDRKNPFPKRRQKVD